MEAVRVYTRYDLPDDKGETRRERNLRFGQSDSPEVEIPYAGEYLWELFTQLSNAIHRVDFNGYYYNLPPSEIIAWCKLKHWDITADEYDIISAMDNVFCKELNKDRDAISSRKLEEQKQEVKHGRRNK